MGPFGVVECHPVFDDLSGLEAVSGYCQVVDSRLCFPVKGVDHAVISAV
jgi:hypothetical protein